MVCLDSSCFLYYLRVFSLYLTKNLCITDELAATSESSLPPSPPKERIIYPDPEDERDVYVKPTPIAPQFGDPNAIDPREFQDFISLLQQNSENGSYSSNFNDFSAFANLGAMPGAESPFSGMPSSNVQQPAQIPETKLQKFLKPKIHIGLLSVLTYLFITMSGMPCNVFLIFLLWEVVEIFLLRQHETNSGGFIYILCMLAGIPAIKVNIALKWIQLINKVLRDVAIFLFFFVISHISYIQFIGEKVISTPVEEIKISTDGDKNNFNEF